MYGRKPRKILSISFTKYTTVFQVEIAAVHHCTRVVQKWTELGKSVAIFSKSYEKLKKH